MVSRVGVRMLQQHASEVVCRAAAGEIVEITDRGRPVARLVPLASGELAGLITAGHARPARAAMRDLPGPLPAPAGSTVTQILAGQRASER